MLDAGLQYRMVRRLVLTVVISVGLFSSGFAVFYWASYILGDNLFKEYIVVYKQVKTIREISVDGKLEQQRSYETLAQPPTTRLQLILPIILLNNLLIIVVLAAMGFWYSHKFAGPVYRIRTVIYRALAGDHDMRITLRDRDELKDLAEAVNALLSRLDQLG